MFKNCQIEIIDKMNNSVNTNDSNKTTEEKPKCKACCACPETKKPRDQCIVEKGEANCTELIEAHKECMRKLGFKV